MLASGASRSHSPAVEIVQQSEKGQNDRTLPVAAEAAELLQTVPDSECEGLVFKLKSQRNHGKSARVNTFSPIIVKLGRKPG